MINPATCRVGPRLTKPQLEQPDMTQSAVPLPIPSGQRVGIVVGKYDSPYYGQLLDSATQQLESYGYSVLSRSTAASSLGVQDVWQSLIHSDCQGIILNSIDLSDSALQHMVSTNPNIVLINRYFDKIPSQCVHLDNVVGASLAVEHLVEKGHRNIAMITGPEGYSEVNDRSAGFKQVLRKHGLPFSNQLVECGHFTSDGGAQAFRRLLQSEISFSALFVQSDIMAAGVIAACQEEGIATPAEMSIVGFDDAFAARITNPKLTTVRQPIADAGIRAAKTLHTLISTESNSVPQSAAGKLIPELVIRDSVQDQQNASISNRQKRTLTPREMECLQWTTRGCSSIEISTLIGISEDTVNFHLRNVIRKLNARNRTHAVAIAFKAGLVSLN